MDHSNERVLARQLARELSIDELMEVSGGALRPGSNSPQRPGTCVGCTCSPGGVDYCSD
jgi:hypothetical protein